MDPYLEKPRRWRGIHAALIVYCFEALNRSLPQGFVARIEERILSGDTTGSLLS